MSSVGYTQQSEEAAAWADGRIAELMGLINAATAELVDVVAKVIDTGAWGGGGVRSPEHWLAWRAGLSPGRAADLVRMARRLPDLPTVGTAFSDGRLSEDSVKLVVKRVPAERDAEVADLAAKMTVPQLARVLRSLPVQPDEEPATATPQPREGGEVSFGVDDGDRWSLRAHDLPAERGALVAKALEAAREAEFRTRHPEANDGASPRGVTWADALERMALAALETLDGATAAGRAPSERYQVLVHVRADADPAAHLHLGPTLTTAARRRISCGASVRWVLEEEGRPVAWGRRRRTIPGPLRQLIEDRDRGCRAPGCTQSRWLEVHHIVHAEDGGQTIPENLVCLCSRHHDDHHHGVLGICGDPTKPDALTFTDRWGRDLSPPKPEPPGDQRPRSATWHAPTGESLDARWFTWAS